jgi:hypothetical protein
VGRQIAAHLTCELPSDATWRRLNHRTSDWERNPRSASLRTKSAKSLLQHRQSPCLDSCRSRGHLRDGKSLITDGNQGVRATSETKCALTPVSGALTPKKSKSSRQRESYCESWPHETFRVGIGNGRRAIQAVAIGLVRRLGRPERNPTNARTASDVNARQVMPVSQRLFEPQLLCPSSDCSDLHLRRDRYQPCDARSQRGVVNGEFGSWAQLEP